MGFRAAILVGASPSWRSAAISIVSPRLIWATSGPSSGSKTFGEGDRARSGADRVQDAPRGGTDREAAVSPRVVEFALLRRLLATVSLVLTAALLLPAAGVAREVTLHRLAFLHGSPSQKVAMVRTADGTLHLMYQTYAGPPGPPDGLATMSISAAGIVGTPVQALPGWRTTQPGLVALPDGTLTAFFGAISPDNVSSLWGISSSDGGAMWSAATDVGSGSSLEAFDYASELTASISGATPVIALPHGNVVMQEGLGGGANTYTLNSAFDGDAFDLGQAVDAATREVVEGWNSLANPGGDYLQGAAPSVGTPQLVPGQVHDPLVIAGRDKGPGVFAPYTDGTHVRLLRYRGGTVAVGAEGSITANDLAAATGLDGRIWVIWGRAGSDFAVTRSNKAVTKFEPIQLVKANAFGLWRIFGDGRLGPLDLFADEVPSATPQVDDPGLYYGRVRPELSATASVERVKDAEGVVVGSRLNVKVTDAGDAVVGAKVTAEGKRTKTSATGVARFAWPWPRKGPVTMTITDLGYQPLSEQVRL